MISIYTDGSFRRPNIGACGYVMVSTDIYNNEKIIDQKIKVTFDTTINVMEITGILMGLEALTQPTQCVVYSDSQYAVLALTRWIFGWIKYNWTTSNNQPVRNKDLLLKTFQLLKYHNATLTWVKAHNGNRYNEIVDGLVQQATKKEQDALLINKTINTEQPTTAEYILPSRYGGHIAQPD